MTTLVEFLRARLDERKAQAWAATDGPWRVAAEGSEGSRIAPDYGDIRTKSRWIAIIDGRVQPEDGRNARHIVANDPSYVLADIAAKRRIVDYLGHTLKNEMGWDGMDEYVLECLALPFAAHPDYDPSWRPAEVTA